MIRRNSSNGRVILIALCLVILGGSLTATYPAAQWVNYPTAGLPRKPDGTIDMAAPVPRLANGKPDFSGTWTSDEVDPRRPMRRRIRGMQRRLAA